MKLNVNYLKVICILVTSLLIVSTRISGGDQNGWVYYRRIELRGKTIVVKKMTFKKIMKRLDDR